MAPQLDVVSRPNLEAKVQRKSEEVEQREIEIWRKEFWQEILDYINQRKPPFRTQRPGFDHWSVITLGRRGFHIGLLLNSRDKRVGCEFVLAPSWKKQAFEQLLAERTAIASQLGSGLQWLPLPDKKRSRILLEADIDPKNPANRDAVKEWMYRQSLAFYQTFQPRVQKLQESYEAASSEESESE